MIIITGYIDYVSIYTMRKGRRFFNSMPKMINAIKELKDIIVKIHIEYLDGKLFNEKE